MLRAIPAYVLVSLSLIYGLESLYLLRMFLGQVSSPVSCGLNPDHRHLLPGSMLALANLGFLLGLKDKTRSGNDQAQLSCLEVGNSQYFRFMTTSDMPWFMFCLFSQSSPSPPLIKTGQLVFLDVFILGVFSTKCKAKPQVMPGHKLSISAQLGRKVENADPRW